jgi:hypothetical protein
VARDLHPGAPETAARSGLVVHNQTGRTLAVRIRALRSVPDLDRLLMVSIGFAGERPLIRPVGELGRWSARPLVLRKGRSRRLVIRAWLPAGLRSGYQGRIVDIDLQLRGRAGGV